MTKQNVINFQQTMVNSQVELVTPQIVIAFIKLEEIARIGLDVSIKSPLNLCSPITSGLELSVYRSPFGSNLHLCSSFLDLLQKLYLLPVMEAMVGHNTLDEMLSALTYASHFKNVLNSPSPYDIPAELQRLNIEAGLE